MKLWKRLTALCLSALVCTACLTACGGEAAETGTTLSVCVGEAPVTYDPIYAQEIGDQTVLNHLYENLMRLERDENSQLTLVNGAARSVDMKENADGTVTYTFRLRGGKWSDGVEVKAGDFVYAWRRLADPATSSPYASLLSIVAGYDEAQATGDMTLLQVSAKNSTTLVVTLSGHYDWFLREVCTATATMPLRQDVVKRLKQAADEVNETLYDGETPRRWWSAPDQLVTNGAYTAFELSNETLTLTENAEYGKKLTGPDQLVFHFGDAETAQTLYEHETVDLIWPLTEAQMQEKLAEDETWQAEPLLETYTVLFNCARLEDDQVRRALDLAIDRTALAALAGVAAHPAEGLVPYGVYHSDTVEDFRSCGGALLDNDPETYADRCAEALELLKNAGYDRGSDLGALEYLYLDEGSNAAVAESLCAMWQTVLGLRVTPVPMTKVELMTALRGGSYTLAGLSVTAVCNDAECFLWDWISGSSENLIRYENSAYDTLMSIIAGAADGSARLGCLHDAEDLLLEIDCALSPLYSPGTAWELRETYLGGFRDPRGWFDFRSVCVKPVTIS